MNKQNLVDKSMNLSIRLSSGGFSLLIENANKETVSYEKFLHAKTDILSTLEAFKRDNPGINTVEILIETVYYTLVPRHLFRREDSKHYMKMQHPDIGDSPMIYFMQIGIEDAFLLFEVDTARLSIFQQVFPKAIIQHHLFPHLKSTRAIANEVVSAIIREDALDIIVFEQDKLKLLNSYEYQTEEDIIYHIMNVFHLLNLNFDSYFLEIIRSKDIHFHPEDFLKKYISNIRCSTQN